MGSDIDTRAAGFAVLDREEVEGVLRGAFYSEGKKQAHRVQSDKPTHYKVICISMYKEDLEKLDQMVDALKEKGLTKANRSALIRHALAGVDLDKVPRGL